MFSRTLVGRVVLSICSIGSLYLITNMQTASAESLPENVISLSSLSLSESDQFEAQRVEVGLNAIAQDINTGVEVRRQQVEDAAKAGMLDFADLPIIGSLLESRGKFSLGNNSPVSFSVGSVMGSYGVVMNADL